MPPMEWIVGIVIGVAFSVAVVVGLVLALRKGSAGARLTDDERELLAALLSGFYYVGEPRPASESEVITCILDAFGEGSTVGTVQARKIFSHAKQQKLLEVNDGSMSITQAGKDWFKPHREDFPDRRPKEERLRKRL